MQLKTSKETIHPIGVVHEILTCFCFWRRDSKKWKIASNAFICYRKQGFCLWINHDSGFQDSISWQNSNENNILIFDRWIWKCSAEIDENVCCWKVFSANTASLSPSYINKISSATGCLLLPILQARGIKKRRIEISAVMLALFL